MGLVGEAFLSPNALTSAEGRSFFDRAFVIKLSGAYRAPGDVRVGMVARYQDGLPFSRMVLTDAFIQGRDLVMAIPRGAQRFTYMFTLDAKVEKDLTFGRRRVGLIVEAYNLTERHHRGRGIRRDRAVVPRRCRRCSRRARFGSGCAWASERQVLMASSVYDFDVTTLDGSRVAMADYRGKTLLIVNVASACGFTPQYTGLEALYRKYHDRGFEVLGFPCNQFGGAGTGIRGGHRDLLQHEVRRHLPAVRQDRRQRRRTRTRSSSTSRPRSRARSAPRRSSGTSPSSS